MAIKLVLLRFMDYKQERKRKMAQARLALLMYIKLGRKVKRKGGVVRINTNRARNALTL